MFIVLQRFALVYVIVPRLVIVFDNFVFVILNACITFLTAHYRIFSYCIK